LILSGIKRGKYSTSNGHKERYKDPEERKKHSIKLRKKASRIVPVA